MGLFDRLHPTGQAAADSGDSKADTAGQDATRLIDEGHVLEAEGRLDEAMQCYLDAIRLAPNPARAHLNRGNILLLKGDLQGALDAFGTAIKHKPDYAGAYYNIGNALLRNRQFDEAVESYRQALRMEPDYAEVHCALGVALKDLGQLDNAIESFQRALQINPDLAEAHINLGNALQGFGQSERAVESYQQALKINPDLVEAHMNLGLALKDLGQLEGAMACYQRALEIDPDHADARGGLLFSLNYTAGHTPAQYIEHARQYGRIVTGKAGARFSDWQCEDRPERLRVGLLSGDLLNHPVGYFLEGPLAHIDPSRIELIAYPTNIKEDELTARIRPYFSAWKPLFSKNDEAAARLIHADAVHVLVDLAGHTGHNRLPVFAWKPAPVQVSWLGYWATTGVAEMDYLLADKVGVPEGQRAQFIESIWYLPDTRLCFTAPKIDLPVVPLPALSNGTITLGCFQIMAKLSEEVLEAWGKIFAALPNAILRLQCKQLDDSSQVEQLLHRLQRYGIAPARVRTHGSTDRETYLAAHAEVDIILDTFPYTGGTTTCEALWMGVPTVTLAGYSLLARQGASLLTAAGLEEWIATSKEEYAAKTIALASDLPKLAALRAGLRQQVLASPLFDAPRFARNFEDALWGMWQTYQDKQRNLKRV
jgi:protein O-GlcNAc transferase